MNKKIDSIIDSNSDLRPLSPHLQVYRWQWSMFFSIVHRMTGLYVSLGMVFLSVKIILLGFFEDNTFSHISSMSSNNWFLALQAMFTWCLLYHMLCGVRHLIWDTGAMLNLGVARVSGYFVFLSSLALTVLYWL